MSVFACRDDPAWHNDYMDCALVESMGWPTSIGDHYRVFYCSLSLERYLAMGCLVDNLNTMTLRDGIVHRFCSKRFSGNHFTGRVHVPGALSWAHLDFGASRFGCWKFSFLRWYSIISLVLATILKVGKYLHDECDASTGT